MRFLFALLFASANLWAQDGAALFRTHCVSCHPNGNRTTRAPLRLVLTQMSRPAILAALNTGNMKSQGARLLRQERAAVADFLADREVPETNPRAGLCPNQPSLLADAPAWNGWGVDLVNSRFQPFSSAGLTPDQVPRLRLKWAFGFPGATTVFGQPTVFGGRLYFGSADGTVYSIDARSGCIYWRYKALSTVRTAVLIDPDTRIGYFGDLQATVYAVDATNGALLWKVDIDAHSHARITAALKLHAGWLYVPVSSFEELAADDPKYGCCTFRGSVVALDAATGRRIWKTYTIFAPPKKTHLNSSGTQLWGPSGAAVWSSPTLDLEKKAIYVGTGDGYSAPSTKTSDAVIAFDMESGKVLWTRQLTPADNWNISCSSPEKLNCPESPGGDFDIGASPILRRVPGGRLLLVGQKSGIVHALDPDQGGKIVWQVRLGAGGMLGGIEWGGAADDKRAYFALSDWDEGKPEAGGGLFALEIASGKKIWSAAPPKPSCLAQAGCSAAQMAPVTMTPGVVFSGSTDGHLRAYDATNGALMWDFDTLSDFDTVNGVKAHGGSLGATGPTLAGGMLYVDSGYGALGLPGNALLAFSVDGK